MQRLRRRVAVVRLEVRTNLDASDLEERLVNFLDPEQLRDSLLEGERIEMRRTTVEVDP